MKDKASAVLRAISIGKYQTTLYTKQGVPHRASIIGGIVTLLLAVTLGTVVIVQSVNVFSVDHFNLDDSLLNIDAYQMSSNG